MKKLIFIILVMLSVSCEHYVEVIIEEEKEMEEVYDRCYITKQERHHRHGGWQTKFIYKSDILEPSMIYEDKQIKIFIFCE